jgi:hypothetical protein
VHSIDDEPKKYITGIVQIDALLAHSFVKSKTATFQRTSRALEHAASRTGQAVRSAMRTDGATVLSS